MKLFGKTKKELRKEIINLRSDLAIITGRLDYQAVINEHYKKDLQQGETIRERLIKLIDSKDTLQSYVDSITDWGKEKGWELNHEVPEYYQIEEKLLLIISEISEALEELRTGRHPLEIYHSTDSNGIKKPEGFGIELADVQIRLFHLFGLIGINADYVVSHKMEYNRLRPYRHGGKLS